MISRESITEQNLTNFHAARKHQAKKNAIARRQRIKLLNHERSLGLVTQNVMGMAKTTRILMPGSRHSVKTVSTERKAIMLLQEHMWNPRKCPASLRGIVVTGATMDLGPTRAIPSGVHRSDDKEECGIRIPLWTLRRHYGQTSGPRPGWRPNSQSQDRASRLSMCMLQSTTTPGKGYTHCWPSFP